MDTPIFDRTVQTGTESCYLRLADGHSITLVTHAGAPHGIDEVYLWPGLDPEGDAWAYGDSWGLWLIGETEGQLHYEVPVGDVRALIVEHGGEHSDQIHPNA